ELRRRYDQPHVADDRLQDDAGDAVAMMLERGGQPFDVVVAERERVLGAAIRYAGTVRHTERGSTGSSLHKQAIDMAVIAAGKLADDVTPSETAGQANGAHRRLGAGANHAHHLDRWHRLDDQLREVRLTLGRCTKACPLVQRLLHSSHDARVAVPKDERAPR